MIRIVIASSSFNLRSNACLDHIKQALNYPSHAIILLDFASMQNSNSVVPTNAKEHSNVTFVNMSEWSNNGEPDSKAIRLASKSISSDSTIVIDSTGLPYSTVSAILFECHQAWFHLDEWQRGFVLICDDSATHRFVHEMSMLFCIPSEPMRDEFIGRVVNKIRRRASFIRWFGFGKITKSVKLLFNIKNRLNKLIKSNG